MYVSISLHIPCLTPFTQPWIAEVVMTLRPHTRIFIAWTRILSLTLSRSTFRHHILANFPQTKASNQHSRYIALASKPTFKISSSATAKVSSPILLQRTVSYDATSKPPNTTGTYPAMSTSTTGRRRRSSSLLYTEPPETVEHMSDQAALPNLNANWVNAKGG